MEIDFKTGDLVKWFGKVAIVVYAHPCDPMTQINCEGKMHWAMRDKIKLVEA